MSELLFQTAKRYFSVPEKPHILAELAEGLLTDAQATDKKYASGYRSLKMTVLPPNPPVSPVSKTADHIAAPP